MAACTELERTITIRPGLGFHVVLGAEADDPYSQAFAAGRYPAGPLTELMFRLIRPGDTVLDLGAHIGTFALAAAALGCRVLAIEASPRNADLLRQSRERNGFGNLHVVHAAVGNHAGTVQFIPHGPHGLVYTPAIALPSVLVQAVTVDELLAQLGWPRVDWIKMDVEGSEIAAVEGMAALLTRADAPPILYECNAYTLRFFGKTAEQLTHAVAQHGYRHYLVESGPLLPVAPGELQPFALVDYLAVKQWPERLTGWPVRGPLQPSELRERFLAACAHDHQHVRGHAAQELAKAPAWLLRDPAVQQALVLLRNDPLPEVRDAAAWSVQLRRRNALGAWLHRRFGRWVASQK